MTNLASLRANPAQVLSSAKFVVDALSFAGQSAGTCRLFSTSREDGVIRLNWGAVQEGASPDYYFPFQPNGVGSVTVPKGAPNGTIVVTGAMNGCGLVVNETQAPDGNGQDKDLLNFHHDANCASLVGQNKLAGKTLLEVTPAKYMTRGIGSSRCDPKDGGELGRSFQHHLITVKANDLWTVLNFGVIVGPGQTSPVVDTYQDGQTAFLIL